MTAQGPVIRQMMVKDFQINRRAIVLTLVFGAVALTTLLLKSAQVSVVGGVAYYTALVIIGCIIPSVNVLNERKKQTLAFNMSLPLSAIEYTTSKLASSVGMFLIPWGTLVLAAMILILARGVLPHGSIPATLIMLTLPLVCLCIITAMTMVGETEGWYLAANIICNSSHGLVWYFMTQMPSLMKGISGSTAIWNRTALIFLGSEVGLVIVTLALTYYLQSRKRDFI